MKKGFTLIELLVVVLIIGILAAIALPQYQTAVMKSKMSGLLPIMRSIRDAQERYYMANGTYTDDFNNLDIQVPKGISVSDCNYNAGCALWENNTWINQLINEVGHVGQMTGGLSETPGKKEYACYFTIYLQQDPNYGQDSCGGTSSKCAQVCKSLGF